MSGDALTQALAAALRPIVADAVAAALAEHREAEAPRPDYLDQGALARALDTSIATVRKLTEDGMPHVLLGDHRRYRLADVHEWLAQRTRERNGGAR